MIAKVIDMQSDSVDRGPERARKHRREDTGDSDEAEERGRLGERIKQVKLSHESYDESAAASNQRSKYVEIEASWWWRLPRVGPDGEPVDAVDYKAVNPLLGDLARQRAMRSAARNRSSASSSSGLDSTQRNDDSEFSRNEDTAMEFG